MAKTFSEKVFYFIWEIINDIRLAMVSGVAWKKEW